MQYTNVINCVMKDFTVNNTHTCVLTFAIVGRTIFGQFVYKSYNTKPNAS